MNTIVPNGFHMSSSLPSDLLKSQDVAGIQAWLASRPQERLDVDTLIEAARAPARGLLEVVWPHCTVRVRHAAARRCVKDGHLPERDRLFALGGATMIKAMAEWGAKEGRLDLIPLAVEGTLPARCLSLAAGRKRWPYIQALTAQTDVRPAFRCLTLASQAYVFERLISAPHLAPLVQQLLDVTRPAAWANACHTCTWCSRPNAATIRCFMLHPQAPAERLAGAMLGLARDEPGFLPLLQEMGQKLAHTPLWEHVPEVRIVPEEARMSRVDWVGTVAPPAVRQRWLAQWPSAMPRSQHVEQAAQRHAQGAAQAPHVRHRRQRA